jgi:predicted ATPase with chaperone activity
LPEAFLRELVLKVIWANDRPTLTTVCNVTGLNMRVVEDVMRGLDREGLCHTDAAPNQSNLQFHYRLTDKGKSAAHDALSRSRYIGVAPVTVNAYREMITRQLALFRRPPFDEIRRALEHLVLPPRLVRMIAQAFFSRRTLMVYGPSGNGKTEIVTSIARTAVGRVIIPYAIYGQGQLIRVFDPEFHKPQIDADSAASEGPWAPAALRHDRRWLPIDRPVVVVGGDMGGDALEMTYDPTLGIHHAPLSVVAQGGVLVIDDLGRQRVSAKEILNRWVLMMEQGADTFSLSTSEVVRLPLDVTLIFSTNLTIQELVDEAYMRRIAYKIAIPNPSADELAEITRRFCTRRKIDWTEPAIQHLVGRLFASGQEPRGCYPRDIITTIIDEAEFEDREPAFDEASIDMATALYLGIDLDED